MAVFEKANKDSRILIPNKMLVTGAFNVFIRDDMVRNSSVFCPAGGGY